MALKPELRILTIQDREYKTRTGDRWIVALDIDGTPAYDGTGATIEEAMANLIFQFAEEKAQAA